MTTSPAIHSFHIPVMGLAFTIDSPIRVAQYGIDSVLSIVDDELAERMNAFYSRKFAKPYHEITRKVHDYRAKRITAYLNLVDEIVGEKFQVFCRELSQNKSVLDRFIAMLPPKSEFAGRLENYTKQNTMTATALWEFLTANLRPGAIDVNIMTKVDKANFDINALLPVIFNDAHAALRGYANSTVSSSLVLSAGMNPSLYGYLASFPDFFPDLQGRFKKKVILKVSDFRSALIQGSFLAKKGIWVSEYRIESGLNCGGHAFATEGILLGPVMEEFKNRKASLYESVKALLDAALSQKGFPVPKDLALGITVQGGIGTAEEHDFMLGHYHVDSVGWGSPFLLVPEATCVDAHTRKLLAAAQSQDLYLSNLSPLGVPFNTVRGTTNDFFKQQRIVAHKPGSSCPKKLLALNTEYDPKGICTASRKFQQAKLEALQEQQGEVPQHLLDKQSKDITVKACLCAGLANAAYDDNGILVKGEAQGIVVCPGPNIAYFNKSVSLLEMVGHIYGRSSVMADQYRPNVFINELQLYVDYLRGEIGEITLVTPAQIKKWTAFKSNLLLGIGYYENLFAPGRYFKDGYREMMAMLRYYEYELDGIFIPVAATPENA